MSIDDDAEAAEQRDRDFCLAMRKPELPITGFCHWCDDVAIGVFCSVECQKDYEQQERFRR